MTDTTIESANADAKNLPFGKKLQNAREKLGIDRHTVAQQLRLKEKIIIMMEKDRYPQEIPITFVKGYLRAYGRFLQLADDEINNFLERIPAKNHHYETPYAVLPKPQVTGNNYLMQSLTGIITITMLGLMGSWWYNHPRHASNYLVSALNEIKAATQAVTPPITQESSSAQQVLAARSANNSSEINDVNTSVDKSRVAYDNSPQETHNIAKQPTSNESSASEDANNQEFID